MIFWIGPTAYSSASAVAIVREMERNAPDYPHKGGSLRQFLRWSFAQLGDNIPSRELALSNQVSDETLALSFLCLLDEYGLGELRVMPEQGQRV